MTVGFSLTTLDDDLARVLEPGAAAPSRRLAALERVAAAGIPTWVFVAPVIPGVADRPEVLSHVVREVRARGAGRVDCDPLNFYPAAVSKLSSRLANGYSALRESLAAASRRSAEWRREMAAMAETIL